ncbi:MAG: DNA polymerase III subunit alpha [bacterium]|nr:DNA polymerase III subunit alpha [bacterium]
MFIHLSLHSHYSLLRGTASPEQLCAAVQAQGGDTIALTDTNGLYGMVLFLQAAKEYGLRPIIGAELRVGGNIISRKDAKAQRNSPNSSFVNRHSPFSNLKTARATLLVKNRQGYANLCRILSDYYLDVSSVPPSPENEFSGYSPAVLAGRSEDVPFRGLKDGSPGIHSREEDGEDRHSCLSSWNPSENGQTGMSDLPTSSNFDLTQSLLEHSEGLVIITADPVLLEALRGGVEDLYAELVPGQEAHCTLTLAKQLNLPPVATNRVHFINPGDYQLHRLLRAIDLNTTLSRLSEEELESPQSYLKPPQEMEEYFFFCPEAVAHTERIADLCRYQPDFSLTFPQFDGLDAEQTFRRLREEAYRGAEKRYGGISAAVRNRLEHELALIKEKNFAPIFLVVQDIVKQSPRTCGRGSAAASIVSYCLEITHVDPIRHNLYFERFLNPGRIDPPDIDVDFAWDERDDVLAYVFAKYGTEHAAMISNHVTFQKKAAIHEIAKVYGLPEAEITAVTGKISSYYFNAQPDVNQQPALRYHDFSPPWPEIIRAAERLEDVPRHLSVHCGGVVITPGPISDHVPVQRAVKAVNIVQWEKDQAEDAGLVKIDLLGNRSLAVIRDALRMVEENHGVRIEFSRWNPIDDPETQAMIARGETMGVFYVESPATRLLQKKAQVGDFEHLVIHSSIIRPAANPYIHDYLERLKGKPYEPLHPLLADLLDETFGIMVYQEDVSRVAMRLAGFDSSEADELRKILSKKHKQKRLADLQKKFVKGATDRGVSRDAIKAIWQMILSFAGYSFCKPHSASYAMVSFKSAWLRVHYPAEFMAAVISNQGGYYSTFAYISESRRMGIDILPPDINQSRIRYWGKDRQIRVGLMQIKGLSQKAMERVVEGQETETKRVIPAGPESDTQLSKTGRGKPDPYTYNSYLSFDDFLRRTNLNPADVRLLIKAGVFDALEDKDRRAELMWRLEIQEASSACNALPPGAKVSVYRTQSPLKGAGAPFTGLCKDVAPSFRAGWEANELNVIPSCSESTYRQGVQLNAPTNDQRPAASDLFSPEITEPPKVLPYNEKALLQHELESFGFLISRHPLELYRERLSEKKLVDAVDLHLHVGKQVQVAGWLITGKIVPTKNKELMEFLTFEDLTGLIETVFFPQVYDRYCHMLNKSRPYILKGKVEEDFGAVTLTVDEVRWV